MLDLSKPFCLSFVAEDNCVCCHVVEQLQLDSVGRQKDFPPWLRCKTMQWGEKQTGSVGKIINL